MLSIVLMMCPLTGLLRHYCLSSVLLSNLGKLFRLFEQLEQEPGILVYHVHQAHRYSSSLTTALLVRISNVSAQEC